MKFVVKGVEVDAIPLNYVTGNLNLELKRQTGLGIRSLTQRLEELPRLGYDDNDDVIVLPEDDPRAEPFSAVYDSEPHYRALLAWLWLSRRAAGEQVSFVESSDFPMSEFGMVMDEDDADVEEDDADPSSPSDGSAQAAADGAEPPA